MIEFEPVFLSWKLNQEKHLYRDVGLRVKSWGF